MLSSVIPTWFQRLSGFWLILCLSGLMGCWTNKTIKTDSKPVEAAPARVGGILVEKLNQANLQLKWTAVTPLGRAKGIRQLFYHHGQLFVISDHNQLCAYEGATGILRWSAYLGDASVACSEPTFYGDNLLFVVGAKVTEIRGSDGNIELTVNLPFKPTTTMARSKDCLFVGGDDNWFNAIRLVDSVPVWRATASAPCWGTVAVANNYVYFTRMDGTIQVSNTNSRSLVWQARAAGRCAGVTVNNGQCLVASSDTALYSFDPNTGVLQWKYLAGGSLSEMPALTTGAIYQPVDGRSLVCLNRDGKLRWDLPMGWHFLAEKEATTYIMTTDNQLTVMNNTDGTRKLAFYVPNMRYFAENVENSMIYMATADGHILALAP